jgi:hypothetical protein
MGKGENCSKVKEEINGHKSTRSVKVIGRAGGVSKGY